MIFAPHESIFQRVVVLPNESKEPQVVVEHLLGPSKSANSHAAVWANNVSFL